MMNKWILAVALVTVAAAPAHAAHRKSHHGKHRHTSATAVVYPDSVMLDGKEYKVCKAGMQDDCVQPRDAGLGLGQHRANTNHAGKMDHHR